MLKDYWTLSMSFATKVVELRKEKGLSQIELAQKLGVGQQIVSGWETGKNMPQVERLIKLAELFKVSLDYLLMENVPREGTHKIDDFELYEVFRKADSLPDKEKEIVRELVASVVFRHIVKAAEEKSANKQKDLDK